MTLRAFINSYLILSYEKLEVQKITKKHALIFSTIEYWPLGSNKQYNFGSIINLRSLHHIDEYMYNWLQLQLHIPMQVHSIHLDMKSDWSVIKCAIL